MAINKDKAAAKAATIDPPEGEPMVDNPSAAPELAETNASEAKEGAEQLETGLSEKSSDDDIEPEQPQAEVELVVMRRDAPLHEGGPTTADVHPDEVDNWLGHGWQIHGVEE